MPGCSCEFKKAQDASFCVLSGLWRGFWRTLARKWFCQQTDGSTVIQTPDRAERLGGKHWILPVRTVLPRRRGATLQVRGAEDTGGVPTLHILSRWLHRFCFCSRFRPNNRRASAAIEKAATNLHIFWKNHSSTFKAQGFKCCHPSETHCGGTCELRFSPL